MKGATHWPWFEFRPAWFERITLSLTVEERGVFIRLLCAIWVGRGSVSADPAQLAAIARITPYAFRQLAPHVMQLPLLVTVDGRLSSPELSRQLRRAGALPSDSDDRESISDRLDYVPAPLMPWWKFFVADFLRETRPFDCLQTGALVAIMIAIWDRGGTVPYVVAELASIAGLSRRVFKRIEPTLIRVLKVEGATITHPELTLQIAQMASVRSMRAKVGALGGRASAERRRPSQA